MMIEAIAGGIVTAIGIGIIAFVLIAGWRIIISSIDATVFKLTGRRPK